MCEPLATTVCDVYTVLDGMAPFATALPFDNAGLLVGDGGCTVTAAALALDLTADFVEWAHSQGCELVISHHPVIFHPLKRLDSSHPVYRLAAYGMSAVCAHTNLDAAQGGVNDVLAASLGLYDVRPLADPAYPDHPPMARIGRLPGPLEPAAWAERVRAALGVQAVGYADGGRQIDTVAVCGGAGADLLETAATAGAQSLVTADVRHHQLLQAQELGVTLIDGGHFATETGVICPLRDRLAARFPDLKLFVYDQPDPLCYATV